MRYDDKNKFTIVDYWCNKYKGNNGCSIECPLRTYESGCTKLQVLNNHTLDDLDYVEPDIGETIYFITDISITKTKVGFIGKESFLIEEYGEVQSPYMEWYYKDFGIGWFSTFEQAKDMLLYLHYGECLDEIVVVGGEEEDGSGYWEVMDKEIYEDEQKQE